MLKLFDKCYFSNLSPRFFWAKMIESPGFLIVTCQKIGATQENLITIIGLLLGTILYL